MAATKSLALAGKRLAKLLTSQGVLLMLLSLAIFAFFPTL